jgi:hypothetical protein
MEEFILSEWLKKNHVYFSIPIKCDYFVNTVFSLFIPKTEK